MFQGVIKEKHTWQSIIEIAAVEVLSKNTNDLQIMVATFSLWLQTRPAEGNVAIISKIKCAK